MNSFSQLVLTWMFGRWIFETPEVSQVVAQDVTPLTIFASAFSQLGLLMFGVLASWAMFLGIFRLKNNGNFFGARDGNEAFSTRFSGGGIDPCRTSCSCFERWGSSHHPDNGSCPYRRRF